jgi:serine/threonine protein kinase
MNTYIEIKSLSESKFPVTLVERSGKLFVRKDFPSKDIAFFERELSSIVLAHANLASCIDFEIHGDGSASVYSEYCKFGDFVSVFTEKKLRIDDQKMIRTYFRQLVEAVEYMHSQDIGHLDLKVANLFLDENYVLRVGDFDFSSKDDNELHYYGTPNFRAPEVIKETGMYQRVPADVYSMGICLFVLLLQRSYPYKEEKSDRWMCALLTAL